VSDSPHTLETCPFRQDIADIKSDLRELKKGVLGNGTMGVMQKTDHLWNKYEEARRSNRDLYNMIYKGFVVGVLIYVTTQLGVPFRP
jgi:hypothetical protein